MGPGKKFWDESWCERPAPAEPTHEEKILTLLAEKQRLEQAVEIQRRALVQMQAEAYRVERPSTNGGFLAGPVTTYFVYDVVKKAERDVALVLRDNS